jgi:hypothetical protein
VIQRLGFRSQEILALVQGESTHQVGIEVDQRGRGQMALVVAPLDDRVMVG